MTPKQLEALAQELKLTPLRRRFCELLVLDPERNQTKAYIDAGGAPKRAQEAASRVASMVKVQAYLAALMEGGITEAKKISHGTIRTLGESLAAISSYAAGREPAEIRVYHETVDGKPVTRKVERFLKHEADKTLVKHHTGIYAQKNAPPPAPAQVTINLNVYSLEDLKVLRELRAKALSAAVVDVERAG